MLNLIYDDILSLAKLTKPFGRRMITYGAQSEIGTLRKVLVHKPGAELLMVDPEAPEHFLFKDRPNIILAIKEFEELVETFRSFKVDVEIFNEWNDANQVFVRDTAVITDKGAILANFKARVRQGEERVVAKKLRDIHIPIMYQIKEPGHFEFGDLIFLKPDVVVLGLSNRSDKIGIRQLVNIMRQSGILSRYYVVRVRRPAIHLDMALNIASQDLAAVYNTVLENSIIDILRNEGYEVVSVPKEDFLNLAINWLTVKSDCIVMIDGYKKNRCTRRLLESYGIDVVSVNVSELAKGYGGIRCMTLPIKRTYE